MSLSVIIPSKTDSNVGPCIAAVRKHEPEAKIVVVDDGLQQIPDADMVIPGMKPFAFPRAMNMGMAHAFEVFGSEACVLLNDDALLETPGGFSLLAKTARQFPEYGIVSATTNVAGNRAQMPKGIGLRDEPRTVAFVCVLVPRRTVQAIGLMDERFGGLTADGRIIYGWCDNDYSRRVRNAGLKIGIHDGCFVDHGSLRSTFRGDPRAAGDISASAEIYQAKWGDRN